MAKRIALALLLSALLMPLANGIGGPSAAGGSDRVVWSFYEHRGAFNRAFDSALSGDGESLYLMGEFGNISSTNLALYITKHDAQTTELLWEHREYRNVQNLLGIEESPDGGRVAAVLGKSNWRVIMLDASTGTTQWDRTSQAHKIVNPYGTLSYRITARDSFFTSDGRSLIVIGGVDHLSSADGYARLRVESYNVSSGALEWMTCEPANRTRACSYSGISGVEVSHRNSIVVSGYCAYGTPGTTCKMPLIEIDRVTGEIVSFGEEPYADGRQSGTRLVVSEGGSAVYVAGVTDGPSGMVLARWDLDSGRFTHRAQVRSGVEMSVGVSEIMLDDERGIAYLLSGVRPIVAAVNTTTWSGEWMNWHLPPSADGGGQPLRSWWIHPDQQTLNGIAVADNFTTGRSAVYLVAFDPETGTQLASELLTLGRPSARFERHPVGDGEFLLIGSDGVDVRASMVYWGRIRDGFSFENAAPVITTVVSPERVNLNEVVTWTASARDPDGFIASMGWNGFNGPIHSTSPSVVGTHCARFRAVDDRGRESTNVPCHSATDLLEISSNIDGGGAWDPMRVDVQILNTRFEPVPLADVRLVVEHKFKSHLLADEEDIPCRHFWRNATTDDLGVFGVDVPGFVARCQAVTATPALNLPTPVTSGYDVVDLRGTWKGNHVRLITEVERNTP